MKLEVLILMSQLLLMGCGVTRTDDENEASLGSQQFTLEELSYDPDPPAGLSEEQIAAAICAHYPQKSFSNADYMQIHRSASKVLPNALAIELQFPETDHFITHYGMNDDSTIWNTEAFFSGRYILTMQVPIVVNYKLKTFSVKEGAVSRFFLREAAVCRRDGHTT